MYSLSMNTIGRSLGYAGFVLVAMLVFIVPQAQAEDHPDRGKFHAEVAHALLESYEALATISTYHARDMMPDNRDEVHEKAAHGFKHALELFAVEPRMKNHEDKNELHAEVAHALLEAHETLAIIADYHARGAMPKAKDELHNVVAHGFKQALEKFGVELDMPKHEDRQKFHGQVAHALLESHSGLSTIAHYHAISSMPGKRDELHDQAAHGFKHALELFGVKTNM